VVSDEVGAEEQWELVVDNMEYESDGTSSVVSALSDTSSDILSRP